MYHRVAEPKNVFDNQHSSEGRPWNPGESNRTERAMRQKVLSVQNQEVVERYNYERSEIDGRKHSVGQRHGVCEKERD